MHSNLIWFCQLGLLCDLLWSDPDKEVQGWGENDRGVSFTFGPDIVSKFLAKHDLDLICRAHQVRFISGPSCSKGGVHGIKIYPVDNTVGFSNTYPVTRAIQHLNNQCLASTILQTLNWICYREGMLLSCLNFKTLHFAC